jgi:hypothetical protein
MITLAAVDSAVLACSRSFGIVIVINSESAIGFAGIRTK